MNPTHYRNPKSGRLFKASKALDRNWSDLGLEPVFEEPVKVEEEAPKPKRAPRKRTTAKKGVDNVDS